MRTDTVIEFEEHRTLGVPKIGAFKMASCAKALEHARLELA